MLHNKRRFSIMSAFCPDKKCRSKLFFPFFDTSIECTHCGQRHDRNTLHNVQEVLGVDSHLNEMLKNILMTNFIPKRNAETIKVLGLSNYHCKLLSPLLTKYGMNKRTGKAQLLSEMNQGNILNCSIFGDRAFLIDQEHISIPGFGRDLTGSMIYLSRTLEQIMQYNDQDERLIPIHSDGDGHCLVHAISRALVGRELFWHPLRCGLKEHFEEKLPIYKELFKDFDFEWNHVIEECDPDFVPPDGELLGLRNLHVFGLANVLKRPIILLDSLECMQSRGDYAALFLPSLIEPENCKGKNKELNKPLCIAWSSGGHNHYIPLVGVKKKPLPVLPGYLLPKVWGVPQHLMTKYIELKADGGCIIGGDRSLGDPYIRRLVSSMEDLFYETHGVHPALVADAHHYLYQNAGVVTADRNTVIQNTIKAINESRLYRCLSCDAICEQVIKPQWFCPGGVLYQLALAESKGFVHDQLYPFPLHGIISRYDATKNVLIPDMTLTHLYRCTWCNGGPLRRVNFDGSIVYTNEDVTKTPAVSSTCKCGFKHFWDGKEYDNPPKKLSVVLEWNGKTIKDIAIWFENESDPSLNSNVYDVASQVVQKHFPGEFGSERLVQKVVEQLLYQTKVPEHSSQTKLIEEDNYNDDEVPTKLIVSGKGLIHKEELGLSETEKNIVQRIHSHAPEQQSKLSEDERTKDSTVEETMQVDNKMQETEMDVSKDTIEKFVRVVTSDGQQAMLHLPEDGITLVDLQKWIFDEFKIRPNCQKIKYGFPPKELKAPLSVDDRSALPLVHGDRIVVEKIINVFDEPKESTYQKCGSATSDYEKTTATQLDRLKDTNDPLEVQSIMFIVSANLSNQTVWNYAKRFPELFRRNGLFYQQMARDVGVKGNAHFTLKTFPAKTFCYNTETDSVELCLETIGHFAIRDGMETDIIRSLPSKNSLNCCQVGQSTSTNLQVKNPAPHTTSSIPLEQPFNFKVARTESLSKQDLKSSTGEAAVNEKKPSVSSRSLVRKGPGYSVLSSVKPESEPSIDRLKTVCNQLSSTTDDLLTNRPARRPRTNSVDNEDYDFDYSPDSVRSDNLASPQSGKDSCDSEQVICAKHSSDSKDSGEIRTPLITSSEIDCMNSSMSEKLLQCDSTMSNDDLPNMDVDCT